MATDARPFTFDDELAAPRLDEPHTGTVLPTRETAKMRDEALRAVERDVRGR